jgi:hypothetical protein
MAERFTAFRHSRDFFGVRSDGDPHFFLYPPDGAKYETIEADPAGSGLVSAIEAASRLIGEANGRREAAVGFPLGREATPAVSAPACGSGRSER